MNLSSLALLTVGVLLAAAVWGLFATILYKLFTTPTKLQDKTLVKMFPYSALARAIAAIVMFAMAPLTWVALIGFYSIRKLYKRVTNMINRLSDELGI